MAPRTTDKPCTTVFFARLFSLLNFPVGQSSTPWSFCFARNYVSDFFFSDAQCTDLNSSKAMLLLLSLLPDYCCCCRRCSRAANCHFEWNSDTETENTNARWHCTAHYWIGFEYAWVLENSFGDAIVQIDTGGRPKWAWVMRQSITLFFVCAFSSFNCGWIMQSRCPANLTSLVALSIRLLFSQKECSTCVTQFPIHSHFYLGGVRRNQSTRKIWAIFQTREPVRIDSTTTVKAL